MAIMKWKLGHGVDPLPDSCKHYSVTGSSHETPPLSFLGGLVTTRRVP